MKGIREGDEEGGGDCGERDAGMRRGDCGERDVERGLWGKG